jgi:hypothetical protein
MVLGATALKSSTTIKQGSSYSGVRVRVGRVRVRVPTSPDIPCSPVLSSRVKRRSEIYGYALLQCVVGAKG